MIKHDKLRKNILDLYDEFAKAVRDFEVDNFEYKPDYSFRAFIKFLRYGEIMK